MNGLMRWFVNRIMNGSVFMLLDGLVILPLRLLVILHSHAIGGSCLRRKILFTEDDGRRHCLLAKLCQGFSRQNYVDVAFRRIRVNRARGGTRIVRPVRSVFRGRQLAAETSASATTLSASLTT